MENGVGVPQQIKNWTLMWSSHLTSRYRSKRTEIKISKSYLHSHVDCGIIHNSHDVEKTKCPLVDGWIKKWNITYNGILSRLQKEGNSATCYNMEETGGRYPKWNKPVTEGQILHDPTYVKYLKIVTFMEAESRRVVVRAGGRGKWGATIQWL